MLVSIVSMRCWWTDPRLWPTVVHGTPYWKVVLAHNNLPAAWSLTAPRVSCVSPVRQERPLFGRGRPGRSGRLQAGGGRDGERAVGQKRQGRWVATARRTGLHWPLHARPVLARSPDGRQPMRDALGIKVSPAMAVANVIADEGNGCNCKSLIWRLQMSPICCYI